MHKLLVICGPTGAGKTALALELAQKYKGEIVSADSRQVYKSMDVGTGKDLPKGAEYKASGIKNSGYYELDAIKIWGYDLIEPNQEFSVANYARFSKPVIEDILKAGKLPILVGGTGLYIKGIVDGIPTVVVPQNKHLRKTLSQKTTDELFEILAQQDTVKAASLNVSDRKNPRRLIRAIEVSLWRLKGGREKRLFDFKFRTLFIGLSAPKEYLFKKSEARVEERVQKGVEEAIRKILEVGLDWKDQAMRAQGYRQWKGYFEGTETKEKAVSEWKSEEKKYAKRQITWFKKDKRINWFDITGPKWQESVEKLVKKWYSNADAQKNLDFPPNRNIYGPFPDFPVVSLLNPGHHFAAFYRPSYHGDFKPPGNQAFQVEDSQRDIGISGLSFVLWGTGRNNRRHYSSFGFPNHEFWQ